ncbi:hypothetical protein BKH41_05370 [Helicobacter sp. 12S02232-10]|uniref:hypothetical protein n=1 Tax=Helicobacter sp. 12S02232-10 TaxID=1476197 RepID=UPI000BA543A2|nr:hypothetical protein [Helicobacter sp. 12S02232-10]PAF48698.1 hypothetical protein BKH41_05370 [Helicobacter sp. 12S02232-10]
MKIFLKVLAASFIGGVWYHIGGENSAVIALVLFIFMLFILLMKPIEFQSPEKREDYMQQLKKKRERRLALEAKQKEEQLRLHKANLEREEKRKRELKNKLKNH